MKQVITFPITLKEAYMLSSAVKHFVFTTALAPAFDFIPGQFITVHFEHEGKILKRSYSIANVPSQNNCIEFAAGFVEGGPGSQLLFNLAPGDSIQINGPFGRLVLGEEQPQRTLLIATSTGITPYRAMLSELRRRLQANPALEVVILQGVQRRADLLYGNDFLALCNEFPQVKFRAYYSREMPADRLAHEFSGYVQLAFADLQMNPETDKVYLCGNPGMIDDAFETLKTKGFTTQHIVREKYISSK